MSGISDYLATAVLNHVFRDTDFVAPGTVYVSLHTSAASDVTATMIASECTGDGYAREAVLITEWTAPTLSGLIDTDVDLEWATAASDWGNIVSVGIFDAASAGNLLYSGDLDPPREVLTGENIKFSAGSVAVGLD